MVSEANTCIKKEDTTWKAIKSWTRKCVPLILRSLGHFERCDLGRLKFNCREKDGKATNFSKSKHTCLMACRRYQHAMFLCGCLETNFQTQGWRLGRPCGVCSERQKTSLVSHYHLLIQWVSSG